MLEASCDQVFGRTMLNGPFKDGIFPAKLSDAAAAHHWVATYQVVVALSLPSKFDELRILHIRKS